MTDDQAFVRAICENPDDATPRLIYADWLTERGNETAAQHIRQPESLRFSFVRVGNECRFACVNRPTMNLDWLDDMPNLQSLPTTRSFDCLLRHGFVEEISCTQYLWRTHGISLVRSQPILAVWLTDKIPITTQCGVEWWADTYLAEWGAEGRQRRDNRHLPFPWFNRLRGYPGRKLWENQTRFYPEEGQAQTDLSQAVIHWARDGNETVTLLPEFP